MRFGLSIPNFAEPDRLLDVARAVDGNGWDGFFLWDHIVVDRQSPVPISEPWTVLAAAAMVTSRVRLGTLVTPVARRRPWVLARQVTTVDHLSGDADPGRDREGHADHPHHRRRPGDGLQAALPAPAVDARLTGVLSLGEILREGAPVDYARPRSAATTCCSCSTPAAPPACPRARACRTATWWPTPSSTRPSCARRLRPGEDVVVTALPLYHIFALMVNLISYFSLGAQNWLVANPRDIDGLIDTLKQSRPTVFTGVNTLYAGLAAHPRLEGGRLLAPAPGGRRRRRRDAKRPPSAGRKSPASSSSKATACRRPARC